VVVSRPVSPPPAKGLRWGAAWSRTGHPRPSPRRLQEATEKVASCLRRSCLIGRGIAARLRVGTSPGAQRHLLLARPRSPVARSPSTASLRRRSNPGWRHHREHRACRFSGRPWPAPRPDFHQPHNPGHASTPVHRVSNSRRGQGRQRGSNQGNTRNAGTHGGHGFGGIHCNLEIALLNHAGKSRHGPSRWKSSRCAPKTRQGSDVSADLSDCDDAARRRNNRRGLHRARESQCIAGPLPGPRTKACPCLARSCEHRCASPVTGADHAQLRVRQDECVHNRPFRRQSARGADRRTWSDGHADARHRP
jgi:hypothetical protein